MSTLQVTTISSPNATSDLVIKTGNTTGPQIVVSANGVGVYLKGNSSSNSVFINSTDVYVNGSIVTPTRINLTVTGGNNFISGNATPNAIASNTSAWNPGTSGVYVIRMQANSSSNNEHWISGLTAATNGQIVILSNIGSSKITLRNEDSANETTEANRFNLGNHVAVQGFGSMKLIYDGTLARWRPMNSSLIAFDHKYSLTKGFFSGGYASPLGNYATADRTTYSTETTVAVAGANLTEAKSSMASVGNADKGLFAGGSNNVATATVNRTTYSTETTAAVTGANLSAAKASPAAAGNADKGFYAGGQLGAPTFGNISTTDRTTYSSETTASVSGCNLSSAISYFSATGNVDKGFFSGGSGTPSSVATANRINYFSETAAAVTGANLSQARDSHAAAGNSDKGFFSGGETPYFSTADRTTYSSETTAVVSGAKLTRSRYGVTAAGNDTKGFFSGGSGSTFSLTISDRTAYSSETTVSVPSASLSLGRDYLSGV